MATNKELEKQVNELTELYKESNSQIKQLLELLEKKEDKVVEAKPVIPPVSMGQYGIRKGAVVMTPGASESIDDFMKNNPAAPINEGCTYPARKQ